MSSSVKLSLPLPTGHLAPVSLVPSALSILPSKKWLKTRIHLGSKDQEVILRLTLGKPRFRLGVVFLSAILGGHLGQGGQLHIPLLGDLRA